MYRQARFLDFKTRKCVCSALIQCHLDFCCLYWCPGLNKGLTNKQQLCQKIFVKFINGMGPRESVNYYSLAVMSLLNVERRNMQLRLNHVFKMLNDKCLSYEGHSRICLTMTS